MNDSYYDIYKKCKNLDKYLKELHYSHYYKTTPEEIADNKIKTYLLQNDYNKCIKKLNIYEMYLTEELKATKQPL
jgi:hypothetical protein